MAHLKKYLIGKWETKFLSDFIFSSEVGENVSLFWDAAFSGLKTESQAMANAG